jgi:membrane protease YdiL (CAAX protease family)
VVNDSISATSPVWPTSWPKDSFKGIGTWLLACVLALFCIVAFLAARSGQVPKNLDPSIIVLGFLAQFVIEAIIVAAVLFALPRLSKFSLRQLGFRAPRGGDLLVALAGGAGMIICADGGAALLGYLTHSQHQQDIVAIFKELHSPSALGSFIVFAVVFAPFAEETIFRLFFFNLGLRYGGFWTGAVLSGVFFGFAHGDKLFLLPLGLAAIVLCAVYYFTRNAFMSMTSHALFNTFSIVMLLAFPKLTQ